MKSRKNIPLAVLGISLCAFLMLSVQADANPPSQLGYCIQPPFIVAPKQPNVLIILDNSGSMNCLAYQTNYDPTQFTTGTYYGYFDPAKNYQYYTSGSPTATNPNRWIPTAAAMNTGTAANPIASGNLLNWITMSRQDIAKRLLIGGRAGTGTPSNSSTVYADSYNPCDRSTVATTSCPSGPYPSSVKLYGNSNATTGLSCSTSVKRYDGTSTNLIYPFNADYNYAVKTTDSSSPQSSDPPDTFRITFADPNTIKLYPTGNYPGSNPAYTFPATWKEYPSSTSLANAYTLVDETTANTSDYIYNQTSSNSPPFCSGCANVTDPALFTYNHADATLATASGTISSITIHAYAKKTGSATVYLQGTLWVNQVMPLPDYIGAATKTALSTSWADVPFDYPLNPVTGVAWQWQDLINTSGTGWLKAFGVQAYGASPLSSSSYPYVSQVYIQINVTSYAGGPYNIIVDQGTTPASGILDSMSSEVRFGLGQYNSSGTGGKIADISATTPTYVNSGNVPNIIKTMSNTLGSTSTPLAETLYEMERYFGQYSTYYSSSDYTMGCTAATSGTYNCTGKSVSTNDPYYYGGSINQYVPCTQSYILLLTDGESNSDTSLPGAATTPPYAPCSVTNIKACSGYGLVNPRYGGTPIGQTYTGSGTDYLIDVAYWGRSTDMRTGATDLPTNWQQGLPKAQNVYLYTVFLFGSGSTLLQDASIYGGFQDVNGNGKPDCTTIPSECYRDSNGDGQIYSVRHNFCSNQAPTFTTTCTTDADCPAGGTCLEPDAPITYYEGDDGYKLQASITSALTEILKRAASGTAASVLASGQGSGANLLQAIFYPKRSISGQPDIMWTGTLENLWYYLNTSTGSSTIRENTADTGSTYELNLNLDRIIQFFFDDTSQMTKANLFSDANGDGLADSTTPVSVVDASNLKFLWEAGLMLWNTDASSRTIYANTSCSCADTTACPTSICAATTNAFDGMTEFKTANLTSTAPTLQSLLNTDYTIGTGIGQRTAANNTTVAQNIINYVRGVDIAPVTLTTPTETISYRSRSTAIDLNNNGMVTDTSVAMPMGGPNWSEASKVWKLGDIINSTPRVASWIPLNLYDKTYVDATYTSFTGSSNYKGRGMVFTGANDGMLHAFKLGTLDLTRSGNIMAKLCEDTNGNGICDPGETTKVDLGKEQWAFIPKSALAYLQYLARTDYCHLYYVDSTPYLFDASIEAPGVHTSDYWTQTKQVMCGSNQPCTPTNNTLDMAHSSWRTVLIGGTRLGGACSGPSYCRLIASPYTATATICSDDSDCTTGYSCAKTPSYCQQTASPFAGTTTVCNTDADCAVGYGCARKPNTVGAPATNQGYSSYFALDITNPTAPELMWEFTNPNLGAALSGPAIVKISARNSSGTGPTDKSTADTSKDGKWFVVFASGPTGPVGNSLFKGFSNQNLRLFVLDLKTGSLLRTIDTGIANAFGGSLNNATIDYNFEYQDDALYLGYTKSEDAIPSGTTAWTKGGVLRLITRKDLNGHDVSPTATAANNGTALNPANWLVSKVVDNIGPVTSSIAHLAHYPSSYGTTPDAVYLYLGSGRYFYPFDDTTNQRVLYGFKDPCLSKLMGPILLNTDPVCDDNGGTPATCTTILGITSAPGKDLFDPASCLKDATSNSTLTSGDGSVTNGWYINLDTPAGTAYSERMITDPLAATNGVVFFTTFSPNTDICAYGGSTNLWAVKYDTASAVGSLISGVGLLQVSTGAIDQIGLGSSFGTATDVSHRLGRRTDSVDGVPPTGQGLSIIVPPKAIDTILSIRKK